jgi:hypothetical protein
MEGMYHRVQSLTVCFAILDNEKDYLYAMNTKNARAFECFFRKR